MKVFETIQSLVRIQGYASLASIAACSGLSRRAVLGILDANVGLLHLKGVKIAGARLERLDVAIANARASGKVFWQEKINYGAAVSLEWKNNPEADKLRKGYCCGGLGDSYTVQVVLDTPENRQALLALGMVDRIDPKEWPGYQKWKED